MAAETRVAIASDEDMVEARAEGRAVAAQLGFSRTDATLVATAISEVARNIVVHAGRGEIVIRPVYHEDRHGIVVVARDSGPGIDDPEAAMKDGVGTPGGLGLGLPGAKRLMDEFHLDSRLGAGTTVTMKKWRIRDELERLRERRDGRA
jgi:serine/threonine-protein kinase RsbT